MGNGCVPANGGANRNPQSGSPLVALESNQEYIGDESLWLLSGLAVGLSKFVNNNDPSKSIAGELDNPDGKWSNLIKSNLSIRKYDLICFSKVNIQCTVHSVIFRSRRFVIVTYRGLNKKENFKYDSYFQSSKRARVIRGKELLIQSEILDAFEEAEAKIKETVSIHLTLIIGDLSPVESKDAFLIHNGTCYGGALSFLSSLCFLDLYKGKQICITFGSHRIGGDDAVDLFNEYYSIHGRSFRVMLADDPLPTFPLSEDYSTFAGGLYLVAKKSIDSDNNVDANVKEVEETKIWKRSLYPSKDDMIQIREAAGNTLTIPIEDTTERYYDVWLDFLIAMKEKYYQRGVYIPVTRWGE